MKKFYKDFKQSPLPIQINDSKELYFRNCELKLLKINIGTISDTVFSDDNIIGEIEISTDNDHWDGDSIILHDDNLITRTGERRKSIAYGIELLLHHGLTPFLDFNGYIRSMHLHDDKTTLNLVRQMIQEKNLNLALRKLNRNKLDIEEVKAIVESNADIEVSEIESDDEALWAEFERLRHKQAPAPANNTAQADEDIWSSRSNVDKYDKQ